MDATAALFELLFLLGLGLITPGPNALTCFAHSGIFGKKSLSIEPGFGEFFKKSDDKYFFNQTQDSYSVDMFLRYLKDLNE